MPNIQYVEGDYLITKYPSGAYAAMLLGQEPSVAIPELPKNPILELQKENESLKKQLATCQQSIAELTALATNAVITPTK